MVKLCRKEMEKQKLVEWENSRKIELEQHRSVVVKLSRILIKISF